MHPKAAESAERGLDGHLARQAYRMEFFWADATNISAATLPASFRRASMVASILSMLAVRSSVEPKEKSSKLGNVTGPLTTRKSMPSGLLTTTIILQSISRPLVAPPMMDVSASSTDAKRGVPEQAASPRGLTPLTQTKESVVGPHASQNASMAP